MKVKKFIAATMPEAMQKIRTELGKDAVILQSKEISEGGFLGFFKKKKFEVIAAVDPQPISQKPKPKPSLNLNTHEKFTQRSSSSHHQVNQDVIHEIKHLKKMLEQHPLTKDGQFKPDYQTVYNYLITQEVHHEIATDIVSSVKKHHSKTTPSISEILKQTKQEIENRLKHLSFQGITYSSRIIHLVGPTGVGKTTTLAKLAARSMLHGKKKIAFITTDTYRIAAIEQLKTYARILDVPVEVAYSLEDYKGAIKKFFDVDQIFVDTAGRNFRNENYVKELTNYIQAYADVNVFLVMSLTAKAKDMTHLYERFSHLPNKKVIFTKVDETRQYGSILNLATEKNADIAYLTDGQDVPDDLIEPSASMLSNYIMSDYYDE